MTAPSVATFDEHDAELDELLSRRDDAHTAAPKGSGNSKPKIDAFDIDIAAMRADLQPKRKKSPLKRKQRDMEQAENRRLNALSDSCSPRGRNGGTGSPASAREIELNSKSKSRDSLDSFRSDDGSGSDSDDVFALFDKLESKRDVSDEPKRKKAKTHERETPAAARKSLQARAAGMYESDGGAAVRAFPRWSSELKKALPKVEVEAKEKPQQDSDAPGVDFIISTELQDHRASVNIASLRDVITCGDAPEPHDSQVLFQAAAFSQHEDCSEKAHFLLLDIIAAASTKPLMHTQIPTLSDISDVFSRFGAERSTSAASDDMRDDGPGCEMPPEIPVQNVAQVLQITRDLFVCNPSEVMSFDLVVPVLKILLRIACDATLYPHVSRDVWGALSAVFKHGEILDRELLGGVADGAVPVRESELAAKTESIEQTKKGSQRDKTKQAKLTDFFRRNPALTLSSTAKSGSVPAKKLQSTDPDQKKPSRMWSTPGSLSSGEPGPKTIMNVNSAQNESMWLHKLALVLVSDDITSDLQAKVLLLSKIPFLTEYARNIVRVGAFLALRSELRRDRSLLNKHPRTVSIHCINALVAEAAKCGLYTLAVTRQMLRERPLPGAENSFGAHKMAQLITLEDLACGSYEQIRREAKQFEVVHARWERLKRSISGHGPVALALQPVLLNILVKHLHSGTVDRTSEVI